MKKIFVAVFGLFLFAGAFANDSYRIDDAQVEVALTQGVEVDFNADFNYAEILGAASIQQDKNVWIAVALDFFLGGIAIHRVYLGGKPGLIAIYFFTCGGIFGIVPFIDLIVLVINSSDISAYIGNDKFFMWN